MAKLADGRELMQWVAALVGDARRVTVRATHAQVALDEATVEDAVAEVGRPALLVSVGSGTITDLGKVVSARSGAPLVAVRPRPRSTASPIRSACW